MTGGGSTAPLPAISRRLPRRALFAALLVLALSPAFPDPPAAAGDLRAAAIPSRPLPGEPVTVGLLLPEDGAATPSGTLYAVLISPGGRRLTRASFFNLGESGQGLKAAVLAVPSTAQAGAARIRVESSAGTLGEIPLDIGDRTFAAEEIALNQENTALRTEPDPRKTAESEQLWGILNRTGVDIYAAGNFIPPVTSTRRTSSFGDRRVYRYADGANDTAIHAGVDYGVPRGTAVRACAPGRVVFARFRLVTGNSVILEHLPGVYSLHYHLDQILVAEGIVLPAGALLGESGSTGLSTGPHLHWEIRVAGENADPDAFIARPILDKDAILRTLN